MLLLLIVFTSVCGMAATWWLTGLFYPGGLPHTSVLVALGIALAWGIAYERLEVRYLAGEFDRVRRMLRLWSRSMGRGESLLLRVWMSVEAQREDQLENDLSDTRAVGLHAFAQAWAGGWSSRLSGSPEEALKRLTLGLQGAQGLNRAELLCEILYLRLQRALVGNEADRQVVQEQGLAMMREVDDLLQDSDLGAGGRSRLRYLSVYHQLLRAMLWHFQGEPERAARRFTEIMRSVRELASLRGRRLGLVARVERLLVLRALKGEEEYDHEFTELAVKLRLPGLRLRLAEIEGYVETERLQARREQEARARQEREHPEPAAVAVPMIEMDSTAATSREATIPTPPPPAAEQMPSLEMEPEAPPSEEPPHRQERQIPMDFGELRLDKDS